MLEDPSARGGNKPSSPGEETSLLQEPTLDEQSLSPSRRSAYYRLRHVVYLLVEVISTKPILYLILSKAMDFGAGLLNSAFSRLLVLSRSIFEIPPFIIIYSCECGCFYCIHCWRLVREERFCFWVYWVGFCVFIHHRVFIVGVNPLFVGCSSYLDLELCRGSKISRKTCCWKILVGDHRIFSYWSCFDSPVLHPFDNGSTRFLSTIISSF